MSNKYRIWSPKYELFTHDPRWPSNQHTHEEYVITPSGEVWILVTTDYENYFRRITDEKFIIQQATGLKAANGKEIYEGDLICHIEELDPEIPDSERVINQIFFDKAENGSMLEGNMNYIGFSVGYMNLDQQSDVFDRPNNYQVIGNILENPELIKQL